MEKKVFFGLFALILISALALRLNAINTTEPWWDENLYTVRPYNFFESDHLSTIDQAPLYFYLADLVYKLMGLSIFSTRFLSLFYGLLSIPLLYLLVREFSDGKVALLSSLFLAFSGYHIAYTIGDMGLTAGFFILLFLCFFIKLVKTQEKKYMFFCAATVGITALIKSYALIFAFVCGLFLIWHLHKRGSLSPKPFLSLYPPKYLTASLLLFLLFTSPILIYNYLLFQEKGQMDVIFTKFFRLDASAYAGVGTPEFDIGVLPEHLTNMLQNYFFRHDPAIFSIGMLGLLLILYKRPSPFHLLFALLFILPLLFLSASTGLPKNFTSFAPLVSFFAAEVAVFASSLLSRFLPSNASSYALPALAILILLPNLYAINSNYEKSWPTLELRQEAEKYPSQTTLFIADSRIYNGKFSWALMDRHFLGTVELPYLPLSQDAASAVPTKTILIECVPKDCGWGAGKIDPDFYENEISILKSDASFVREINYKGEPYYRIYSTVLPLEPYSLPALDYLHQFYFYPVGWKNKNLAQDLYKTEGNPLHLLGKIAIYVSIILALAISFYSLYLFSKPLPP